MSIADNIAKVRERIVIAAANAGVDSGSITLIAVTKNVDSSQILEAIDAGVTDIGENYIQDAIKKHNIIGDKVRWHMIGHLQRNKVKQAAPIFDLIQSLDSKKLAEEISHRAKVIGKTMHVLAEVNISGEETKYGVQPDQLPYLLEQTANLEGIKLDGLMGIAPFVDDPNKIRQSFALLRKHWEKLPPANRKWLSMGMTSDFELAIEEGSNMIRIGTAIFGRRMHYEE